MYAYTAINDKLVLLKSWETPSDGTSTMEVLESPQILVICCPTEPFQESLEFVTHEYNILGFVHDNNRKAVVKRHDQWFLFDPEPKECSRAWLKKW